MMPQKKSPILHECILHMSHGIKLWQKKSVFYSRSLVSYVCKESRGIPDTHFLQLSYPFFFFFLVTQNFRIACWNFYRKHFFSTYFMKLWNPGNLCTYSKDLRRILKFFEKRQVRWNKKQLIFLLIKVLENVPLF